MNNHNVNKKVWLNPNNLPFKEYYKELKSTERRENNPQTPTKLNSFLMALANETGVHYNSVRRWAYGTATPNKATKKVVAIFMHSDVETLFPETV